MKDVLAQGFQQPSKVGSLPEVLRVVVDDADQAHTERNGRVPAIVHDAVEVGIVERREVGDRCVVCGVVVAEQLVGFGYYASRLLGRLPIACLLYTSDAADDTASV